MSGPRKGVPRPTEPRTYIGVRLSASGIQQVDDLAGDLGLQRSETLRLLLKHAVTSPAVLRAIRNEVKRDTP